MKIIKDEIDRDADPLHDEFELSQFVVQLDPGDILEIKVNGLEVKNFIPKYSNCHFNMVLQDKGVMREETRLSELEKQRELINRQIAAEESKEAQP